METLEWAEAPEWPFSSLVVLKEALKETLYTDNQIRQYTIGCNQYVVIQPHIHPMQCILLADIRFQIALFNLRTTSGHNLQT